MAKKKTKKIKKRVKKTTKKTQSPPKPESLPKAVPSDFLKDMASQSTSTELPQTPTLPQEPESTSQQIFSETDFTAEELETLDKLHVTPEQQDKQLERFKEFLDNEWGLPAVILEFRNLFGPSGLHGLPPIHRWDIPSSLDVPQLVWEQVQTEAFIEEVWPILKMLLKEDIINSMWAAQAATILSFFNVMKILPIVLNR